MRLLLDTNRYTDLVRGVPDVVARLESAEQVLLPFPVLGELYFAFRNGNRREQNEQRLASFLADTKVSLLLADQDTCRHFGALRDSLRKKGRPIGANDIWIAALALQHDLVLYTRDSDFDNVPELSRL